MKDLEELARRTSPDGQCVGQGVVHSLAGSARTGRVSKVEIDGDQR